MLMKAEKEEYKAQPVARKREQAEKEGM